MATTNINISAVLESSHQVDAARRIVTNMKGSFNSTRYQIDGRILARNNLNNRMQNVYTRISNVETRIGQIKTIAENGANAYRNTDAHVAQMGNEIAGAVAARNVAREAAVSVIARLFDNYKKKQ